MTKFEKEYMESQFNQAVHACEVAAKKNKWVVELNVMKKDKFWNTWAKVNGYSDLVKKSHRFVAVLRMSVKGLGELCYSMSNKDDPENAVCNVLHTAIAGWRPKNDVDAFVRYSKASAKNRKKLIKCLNDFVVAILNEMDEAESIKNIMREKWGLH